MFDYLEKDKGIDITLVSAGQSVMYNGYLPGGKHKARLAMKIEDIYKQVS